jgi:glycosyltransferase involved in cell wall biosynthesis
MLKLTVIMPSLNQGGHIERAIRSVLDQRYPALQFLLVDGGSSDGSVEIIRRFEGELDWWISEPDEGQTHALEKGVARATGDVVAYLNSDDYYLPGAFTTALTALEGSDASWVAGAARNLDEGGLPTHEGDLWVPAPPAALEVPPRGRHWWLLRHWAVPQPAAFWRRGLFDEHGGFRRDMHYAFDVEFMGRLALAGELPLLLPDRVLAVRVLHPGAKSNDTRPWPAEYRLMRRVLRSRLTPRERALLGIGAFLWPPWSAEERVRRLRARRRSRSRAREATSVHVPGR